MAASSIRSARRFSTRIRLGDRVMADVIDALSFEQGPTGRRYINYRDLGVRQLGSIYERLLEHELAPDGDGVAVRPNIFARKGSGSYYTPDDLVGLIVEETIEPLVQDAHGRLRGRSWANVPADVNQNVSGRLRGSQRSTRPRRSLS